MIGHCVTAFKFENTKVYQKQIKKLGENVNAENAKIRKKILEWPETPC